MTYEDMTYEVILQRMMDRVTTQYPNIDNREGSILFNALAPAALELAIMYTELSNAINESFVNTATREYILIGCQEMGMDISVFESSAGVHKGIFNVEVPIGSRWNCDLYNYTVTEYIGLESDGHAYLMDCETFGTAPNNQTGDLTPITDAPSELTSARVVECLIDGENETSDEDIKKAYYDYVNNVATDGNVAQYERWCNEYAGVGNSKIFPLWNGANTVKLSILSASNRAASDELIAEFQNYIDPQSRGMGDGVAPIGAFVTVTTATEIPINVSGTINTVNGYSTDAVKANISKALTEYFSELAYSKNQIPYMTVGAIVLSAEGVDSVTDLTIGYYSDDLNVEVSGITDIYLEDEQIPVLGSTNWTVS